MDPRLPRNHALRTPKEEGSWRLKSVSSRKTMGPQALGWTPCWAKHTCQAVCSLRGEAGWAWGWTAPMGPRRGRCKMGSECVLKGRTTVSARGSWYPTGYDSGPDRGSAGRAGDPLGAARLGKLKPGPRRTRKWACALGNVPMRKERTMPELCLDGQPKGCGPPGLQGAAIPPVHSRASAAE